STTLMSRRPTPPAHQQTGLPKIAATPGFVDRSTLLPQRGPQGAAARGAAGPGPPGPDEERKGGRPVRPDRSQPAPPPRLVHLRGRAPVRRADDLRLSVLQPHAAA